MSPCNKNCDKKCQSQENKPVRRCGTTEKTESLRQKEQESGKKEQNS